MLIYLPRILVSGQALHIDATHKIRRFIDVITALAGLGAFALISIVLILILWSILSIADLWTLLQANEGEY
ncbi:MAG TPA: hypothetical protein V6C78_18490 [Crinalium sp.]|jgi:uncharacterized membrane protein